jgi:hypothetical protein
MERNLIKGWGKRVEWEQRNEKEMKQKGKFRFNEWGLGKFWFSSYLPLDLFFCFVLNLEMGKKDYHSLKGAFDIKIFGPLISFLRDDLQSWTLGLFFFLISGNASRYCGPNGVWDKSNYQNCYILNNYNKTCESESDFRCLSSTYALIYLTGYFISLLALIVALVIFLSFK